MARIISTAIAMPPYKVSQEEAAQFARRHFSTEFNNIEKLMTVFTNSRIESRYFCVPKQWFLTEKSLKEKNDAYLEWACKLARQASVECLEQANMSPRKVDHLIFISTTGLATPSVDARLMNMMNMRPDVSRAPVWGFGCLGGAVGLSMARDYIKAYPSSNVLLVAVELCSLTFQFRDFSKSNFIATALFGDGAAAVLLSGNGDGPQILDTKSHTWPDSLDVMGWNILNEGMQVVFSKAIPAIVSKHARQNIGEFLQRCELTLENIEHFLIHPGGPKVIEAYKSSLSLNPDKLHLTEQTLRNYGNMSSVTILYILHEFLKFHNNGSGEYGLITALGPGFSSENLLFRT